MTTVLVVDDEYLIVEVLTLALEDVGFMVTQASNGRYELELDLPRPAVLRRD